MKLLVFIIGMCLSVSVFGSDTDKNRAQCEDIKEEVLLELTLLSTLTQKMMKWNMKLADHSMLMSMTKTDDPNFSKLEDEFFEIWEITRKVEINTTNQKFAVAEEYQRYVQAGCEGEI